MSETEVGQSSNSSSSDQTWAKLVPSDSRFSDVEIKVDDVLVSSHITLSSSSSSSSSEQHQWCQIIRNSDLSSATLHNKSSHAILADDVVIPNEDSVVINCGTEIIPGPCKEGFLSYRFKLMPRPETTQKKLKISIDVDHAKCCICLSVWHDVVTIAPCFHNFCNGCFSEWLRRSEEKRSNVLCPQCRAVVQFAGRNHFLKNIGDDILEADSSLTRSKDEVAVLDKYASIQSNLVVKSGKMGRRKRAYSPVDELSGGIDLPCPQCGSTNSLIMTLVKKLLPHFIYCMISKRFSYICVLFNWNPSVYIYLGTEYGSFRCNDNTIHLQCQSCGGMMPSRSNANVTQHCLGCDRAFCGAYWHSLRAIGTGAHAMCSSETFKPIRERTISRIPFWAHEKNRHEQDV